MRILIFQRAKCKLYAINLLINLKILRIIPKGVAEEIDQGTEKLRGGHNT